MERCFAREIRVLALGGLHVDNLCAWLERWAGLEREFGLVDLLGASCANAPAGS